MANLWRRLDSFRHDLDVHGVHDMAVEIMGIEIMLRELNA